MPPQAISERNFAMKTIKIADRTLCRDHRAYSFKERLEIMRQLDRLNCDVIELPEIKNRRADILLVRTASSFVKHSVIAVAAGSTAESIEAAAESLSGAVLPRIRIELPVSPVGMEYSLHMKPEAMLGWIEKSVARARELCADVEFCAVDATRAGENYLVSALLAAKNKGAAELSVCDSAGTMLPGDFAAFVSKISERIDSPVGVSCHNRNGLAGACAITAVMSGAESVKTAVGGDLASTEEFAQMVKNCGDDYGLETSLTYTELRRITRQIDRISGGARDEHTAEKPMPDGSDGIRIDSSDGEDVIAAAASTLGYDLSSEDLAKVSAEVHRVAERRLVGAAELEAIIASSALQVPDTYTLESYVVNSGNIISATAQITLVRDGEQLRGISIGDGPIDAAFLAIEQIMGHRYELDDFQIQAVTEGKEAMGSAIVKLRSNGVLYSGNGISTDIIGASIRAYINAVNKIVYEEENA